MPVEISLIIITLDRPALLEGALASLETQTRKPDQVVVIDNGPSPDTARVVESFHSRLPVERFEEPRRGFGAARNRGLREARGGILVFLDDDCRAEPRWIEKLLAPLHRDEADIVGGSRVCVTPGLLARLDYLSTDAPVLHPRLPRGAAPSLSTSNLAMRARVAREVGEFDETLATCEDRDFCLRARARGFRLLYEPAACVEHQPPVTTLPGYARRMVRYGLGTSQYFLRHRREEKLAKMFPASPWLRLMLAPVLAVLGTGYLVWRNWPRRPDALPLSPLLLVGQLYWHWGGYLAAREERTKC